MVGMVVELSLALEKKGIYKMINIQIQTFTIIVRPPFMVKTPV